MSPSTSNKVAARVPSTRLGRLVFKLAAYLDKLTVRDLGEAVLELVKQVEALEKRVEALEHKQEAEA